MSAEVQEQINKVRENIALLLHLVSVLVPVGVVEQTRTLLLEIDQYINEIEQLEGNW